MNYWSNNNVVSVQSYGGGGNCPDCPLATPVMRNFNKLSEIRAWQRNTVLTVCLSEWQWDSCDIIFTGFNNWLTDCLFGLSVFSVLSMSSTTHASYDNSTDVMWAMDISRQAILATIECLLADLALIIHKPMSYARLLFWTWRSVPIMSVVLLVQY